MESPDEPLTSCLSTARQKAPWLAALLSIVATPQKLPHFLTFFGAVHFGKCSSKNTSFDGLIGIPVFPEIFLSKQCGCVMMLVLEVASA